MGNLTNQGMLATLEAAYKGITEVATLGESVLQPEKFDQFVREVQDATVILGESRFYEMDAQQTDIDRIGFAGRILRSGLGDSSGSGPVRELSEGEFANPNTATNKLIAQELQAVSSLRDHALRRNIERGNLENTLLTLFGEAAGRDLEEYALLGDKSLAYSDDDVLSQTDGWLKRAGNKIYGRGADADFDPTRTVTIDGKIAPIWVEDVFQAALEALPKRFLSDPGSWRFYVPWEMYDGYQTILAARGTPLGDRAQTSEMGLNYKGIPIRYVPMLERSRSVNLSDPAIVERDRVEGRLGLLAHPDNLAWGVFHEVTVEPEREAKKRRTDFVLTVEADADYEDENGVVAFFVDKADPQAS